jgi:hypothetical protein
VAGATVSSTAFLHLSFNHLRLQSFGNVRMTRGTEFVARLAKFEISVAHQLMDS